MNFEEKKNVQETIGKPVTQSLIEKYTPSHTVKEEREEAQPTSISSRTETQHDTAQLLIAEGVTPARAAAFAQLFERQRIEDTIQLGIHREKRNPPAYLLRLIQDNTAARRIVPGSEADRVRAREQALPVHHGRYEDPPVPTPAPQAPERSTPEKAPTAASETLDAYLSVLTTEERTWYAQRARAEVVAANAWLGAHAHSDGPLMQAMIRSQLRRMLSSPDLSPSDVDGIQAQHVAANGEHREGVIRSQLSEKLRGDDVLTAPGKARAVTLHHVLRADALAVAAADMRDFDLPEQLHQPRDRRIVLVAKAERLPEVLEHGFGDITIPDRSVKRAHGLGGDDANAARLSRLVPEGESRERIAGRADNLLVLIAHEEHRPLLVPGAFATPSLHDVEKAHV